jgi:hypothetical protein
VCKAFLKPRTQEFGGTPGTYKKILISKLKRLTRCLSVFYAKTRHRYDLAFEARVCETKCSTSARRAVRCFRFAETRREQSEQVEGLAPARFLYIKIRLFQQKPFAVFERGII